MKLNGLKLAGHFTEGERLCFELECEWTEAAALNGQTLTVTEDGDKVEEHFGYTLSTIDESDGTLFCWFARGLSDASKKAIEQLEASVNEMHGGIGELNETAAAAEEKATAAEEKAASADVKAEEAKQAAAQAGASPAVTAAAKAYVNSCTALTNSQVSDMRDLIDDFVQGAEYDKGMTRKYDGKFYRMAQDISATTSQTYLPGPGMESLYTLIDLAADGIRIWHTVTDATNSFALGEKCHHPGEDGPVYVSKRDGNFSEPGTDEWWVLDGSEETGEADTGESEA